MLLVIYFNYIKYEYILLVDLSRSSVTPSGLGVKVIQIQLFFLVFFGEWQCRDYGVLRTRGLDILVWGVWCVDLRRFGATFADCSGASVLLVFFGEWN